MASKCSQRVSASEKGSSLSRQRATSRAPKWRRPESWLETATLRSIARPIVLIESESRMSFRLASTSVITMVRMFLEIVSSILLSTVRLPPCVATCR